MTSVAEFVRGHPLPYLKAWRLRRFLTQDDLIRASGVSRTTLVRAERGDENVTVANIRKLAEALGITPDDLTFTPPGEPPSGSAGSLAPHGDD